MKNAVAVLLFFAVYWAGFVGFALLLLEIPMWRHVWAFGVIALAVALVLSDRKPGS